MKTTMKIIIFVFLLMLSSYSKSHSQIIAPTGTTSRQSSQLVYWYDEYDNDTFVQVTNTNDTQGVWIHVQIFRSFDQDDSDYGTSSDKVICDERDFIDFFTPNDTHIYELYEFPFYKNTGESEGKSGELVFLDLDGDSTPPSSSTGFIVITPVVSESDLTAISFQHLIGNSNLDSGIYAIVNAMGRDAVDFTTGEIVPDNTPLNGTTNGYIVLQPEELIFNSSDFGGAPNSEIVAIAFQDSYGPAGLLGYQVLPASANWSTFIFDFKEDPTSCGNRTINCFDDLGLDENVFVQENDLLGNDVLCSGFEPPDNDNGDTYAWTRIFVSGLSDFDNHLGLYGEVNDEIIDAADWMFVRGERTDITPPPTVEVCDDEAMVDEDEDGFANCLDSDCATASNCETGEEQCADQMDNDNDGQTDCADLGCDGFASCEFGTEVSCNDGIDNDADGAVDGDDSDCQAAETTGGTTGGGGCNVATGVNTVTAAANFLLPLLPLFGAYKLKRRKK